MECCAQELVWKVAKNLRPGLVGFIQFVWKSRLYEEILIERWTKKYASESNYESI